MDTHPVTNSFPKMAGADQGIHTVLSRNHGQEWHWPLTLTKTEHRNRIPLMRTVPYTLSVMPDEGFCASLEDPAAEREGVALSMNLSSGGILLVMSEAPDVEQVLKVCVPTPITGVETPTLAEVRWARELSGGAQSTLYLVGLKFLF